MQTSLVLFLHSPTRSVGKMPDIANRMFDNRKHLSKSAC
jgi:hypothetical protein